ncbi:MAG: hypothetical protein KC535_03315 [Nanoarchaeota archaeon]|nr:hypothetical protein [Nanoarchaeota archaeon]
MTTLHDLYAATVAHTDAGDFLQLNGELRVEFLLEGTITKARAGLFFIDIEGEQFSAHKQDGFSVGDKVKCVLRCIHENGQKSFVVKGLEK